MLDQTDKWNMRTREFTFDLTVESFMAHQLLNFVQGMESGNYRVVFLSESDRFFDYSY
jgi:hypothetical protein